MSTDLDHTEDLIVVGLQTLSTNLIAIEKKLDKLLTLTNELASHLVEQEAAERTRHEIDQVERYISNSGNTTWKAFNQDGDIIYLRQAHKDLLKEAGLWHQLDNMHDNDRYVADIILYTVPDGDFMKPVKIEAGGWVKAPERANPGLERLKELVESGDCVVVDTETTDLNGHVCQIAVLSATGETLLDTLVKPPVEITAEATAVHGITNEMVADSPDLPLLEKEIERLVDGKTIIGWNVEYDLDALNLDLDLSISRYEDAMEAFSPIFGEWNSYHQNYKWQKLTTAAQYYGISTNGAHSAIDDCRMTLEVVKKMVTES